MNPCFGSAGDRLAYKLEAPTPKKLHLSAYEPLGATLSTFPKASAAFNPSDLFVGQEITDRINSLVSSDAMITTDHRAYVGYQPVSHADYLYGSPYSLHGTAPMPPPVQNSHQLFEQQQHGGMVAPFEPMHSYQQLASYDYTPYSYMQPAMGACRFPKQEPGVSPNPHQSLHHRNSSSVAHVQTWKGGNYHDKKNQPPCNVCGDQSAGFHCGAFVCEACKKFFIRSSKAESNGSAKYACTKKNNCDITKESRTHCQYCRYEKCRKLNMFPPGKSPIQNANISEIPCRVCNAPSSGFHFGTITCEGCKGFFRRTIKERDSNKYLCNKGGTCEITQHTRNTCKACRFKKCKSVNMSADASRIGRQPNSVKHMCAQEIQELKHKRKCIQGISNVTTALLNGGQQNGQVSSSDYGVLTPPMSGDYPVYSSALPVVSGGYELPLSNSMQPLSLMDTGPDPAALVSSACKAITGSSPMSIPLSYPQQLPPQEPLPPVNSDIEAEMWPIELKQFREAVRQAAKVLSECHVRTEPLIPSHTSAKQVWNQFLMRHFEVLAKKIIEFSKQVPGMKRVDSNVLTMQLKPAVYPIMLLVMSRSADLKNEHSNSNYMYNFFNFNNEERDIIISHLPGFKQVDSHLHRVSREFQSYAIDDTELALLCAMQLVRPDNKYASSENRAIRQLYEKTCAALQSYMQNKYSGDNIHFSGLVDTLCPMLEKLNDEHLHIAKSMVEAESSNGYTFSQLYRELFLSDDLVVGDEIVENWENSEVPSQSPTDDLAQAQMYVQSAHIHAHLQNQQQNLNIAMHTATSPLHNL